MKSFKYHCPRCLLGAQMLAVVLFIGDANAAPTVLFSDDFNRPNGTDIGNGWFEKGYYSSGGNHPVDVGSILNNRLRFATTDDSSLDYRNTDSGIVRPFPHVCGVVVSGTAEWMNANRNVGLSLDLNAGPGDLTYDGLQLVIWPGYDGVDRIVFHNGGVGFLTEEVHFDITRPNKFEWTVKKDCSTEVRVWPADQARPNAPLVSSSLVTPIARENPQLEIMATGGTGCCRYAQYDLRVDDLVVVTTVTTVSVDIKPGSDPNTVNLGSAGVVPVAILGSATFDATMIDPESLFLAGAAVKMAGKSGKLLCHSEDVNGDGFIDEVCQFQTAEFMIEPGSDKAELTGVTVDGMSIKGEDSISIVP